MYHVVTDAYLLYFVPMVSELHPWLEVVPKNAEGEPVPLDRIDELIVRHADGRELKVWEAVVSYAAAQPAGADGLPRIPDYYSDTTGRITQTRSFPFIGWLILLLAVVVTVTVLFIRRRRLRHKRSGQAQADCRAAW